MSWFSKVKAALFGPGGASTSAGGLLNGVIQSGTAPRRGTKEILDAYRTSPWLHAIVHRLSMEVAQQRLELYTNTKGGPRSKSIARLATRRDAISYSPSESSEVESHPFLDLIEDPNPAMTRMTFMHVAQAYLELKGEVPIVVERGKNGLPRELWIVPPHWLVATPSRASPVYRFSYGGWQPSIPESDVIYLRHPELVNPYTRGVGVAESASDELDIDEYATRHLKTWFFNRAVPDMFLTVQGVNTKDQALQYQEMLRNKYQGRDRGNQIHVSSGEVKITEVGHTFREQNMPELRQQERDFLLQLFGLPPEVMGIIENSNRATIDAARYLLMSGLIVPRLVFVCDTLTRWARENYSDNALTVGFDSPVPEDREYRKSVFVSQPTLFTKNEWRELAGMRPIQGWDLEFPEVAVPSFGPSLAPPAPPTAPEEEEEPEEVEPEEDTEDEEQERGLVRRAWDPDAVAQSLAPERLERVSKTLREEIAKWGARVLTDLGSKASFDLKNPLVTDYLDSWQEQKIATITDTTRAEVTEVLKRASAEGVGIDEAARRLRGYFNDAAEVRAERIARTEVVGSSNAANLAAYQISGLVDEKAWLAVPDDQTRDSHAALDGQQVPISDEFTSITGARAQGPGLFGVPEEDINCRCTVRPMLNDKAVDRVAEWKAWDAALMEPQRAIQDSASKVFGEWLGDALKALK